MLPRGIHHSSHANVKLKKKLRRNQKVKASELIRVTIEICQTLKYFFFPHTNPQILVLQILQIIRQSHWIPYSTTPRRRLYRWTPASPDPCFPSSDSKYFAELSFSAGLFNWITCHINYIKGVCRQTNMVHNRVHELLNIYTVGYAPLIK